MILPTNLYLSKGERVMYSDKWGESTLGDFNRLMVDHWELCIFLKSSKQKKLLQKFLK
jgi:hypothetical protein